MTFTGESRTGAAIMKAVADGVKEVSFELGGKNAAIVFADADFDAAVEASCAPASPTPAVCARARLRRASLFERFVAARSRRAPRRCRWAGRPAWVFMGSLISHGHRDKVLSYFDLAVREGATVVAGRVPVRRRARRRRLRAADHLDRPGGRRALHARGSVRPGLPLAPFDSEDEAIRRANDSAYGTASSVWTTNLSRAHRVTARLHVGIAWVNTGSRATCAHRSVAASYRAWGAGRPLLAGLLLRDHQRQHQDLRRHAAENPLDARGRAEVRLFAVRAPRRHRLRGRHGGAGPRQRLHGRRRRGADPRIFDNLQLALPDYGLDLDALCTARAYLSDFSTFAEFNHAWESVFAGRPLPARTTLGVAALPLGAAVEIEFTFACSTAERP